MKYLLSVTTTIVNTISIKVFTPSSKGSTTLKSLYAVPYIVAI